MKLCAVALSLALLAPALARADDFGPRLLYVPSGAKQTEQGVLTPVPVSLQVPADLPVRRVLLHYHVFGASEWRTLELRREGARYAGAIPCLEVSEMTREIRYYMRMHDAAGRVIAFSGTRAGPYRVALHHPSARPDLADGALSCPDPAECPPGLPGCPSQAVERVPCSTDADCEGGLACGWDHFCGDEPRRKNWLGLDASGGIGLVPAQGACSVASQENAGYACYRARDGAIYRGRPIYSNEPLGSGPAPLRLLVSYQRLLFYRTSLGLRVGYAFAGEGPTLPGGAGFVPYSIELFARYWFGGDAFATRRLRGFVALGAGAAQHDIEFELDVREDPGAPYSQGGNDLEQRLRAWKRAGDAFVSVGTGAQYPLSDGFGAEVELSVTQAFPYAATVLGGSAGVRLGF